MMVKNSTNINKTNSHLSIHIIEHEERPPHINLEIMVLEQNMWSG